MRGSRVGVWLTATVAVAVGVPGADDVAVGVLVGVAVSDALAVAVGVNVVTS